MIPVSTDLGLIEPSFGFDPPEGRDRLWTI